MKKKRIWQSALVLASTPFLGYFFFYATRFVLTGRWVEGGGDRAVLGFFFGVMLVAPVLISEMDTY
jgi:hypothetical protein